MVRSGCISTATTGRPARGTSSSRMVTGSSEGSALGVGVGVGVGAELPPLLPLLPLIAPPLLLLAAAMVTVRLAAGTSA